MSQISAADIVASYHARTVANAAALEGLLPAIANAADMVWKALDAGNTIFFCGNGGSAADSQHLAADILGRYRKPRKGLPAIALTVDTSTITALANDYGYDTVFAQQLDGLGEKGDVLVAISTSGNSQSVLRAVAVARDKGMSVIGMTAAGGGRLAQVVDIALRSPAELTNHAQESHIVIGHMICEYVEAQAQARDDLNRVGDKVMAAR